MSMRMRKIKKTLSFYLGLLTLLTTFVAFSEGIQSNTGTLIVTYKTDNKGERLKRVRFWLKDREGKKLNFYPKANAYVDDPEGPSRMVLLENIQPGEYLIDFLVPNTDRYFKEVLPRKVMISEGEIVKIDQQIKPESSEKNANHVPESSDSSHNASEAELPQLNLSFSKQPPDPVKEEEKDKNSPPEISESQQTVVENSAPIDQSSSEKISNPIQEDQRLNPKKRALSQLKNLESSSSPMK